VAVKYVLITELICEVWHNGFDVFKQNWKVKDMANNNNIAGTEFIDQDVGGWIILGWILERWDGLMWTGLVWLRIGTGGELL
jgi:hypothetical protein